MMKRCDLLFLLILLCLGSGCSGSGLLPEEGDAAQGQEGLFTFYLDTGKSVDITPRAINENTINNVWVVQLNSAGNAALVPPVYITTIPADNKIRVKLLQEESTLHFLANTGNSTLFDTSETDLTQFTTDVVLGKNMTHDGDWATKDYMPMATTWTGTPGTTTLGGDDVKLTRAYARLKITVTRTGEAASKFTIKSMQLKNVPDVLHFALSAASTFPAATGTFLDYSAVTSSLLGVEYIYLVPENCRGTGTERFETEKNGVSIGNNANYATCYEIKGTYDGNPLLYRFYLGGNNTNDYNIRRNVEYTVKITVSGAYMLDTRLSIDSTPLSEVKSPSGSISWGEETGGDVGVD